MAQGKYNLFIYWVKRNVAFVNIPMNKIVYFIEVSKQIYKYICVIQGCLESLYKYVNIILNLYHYYYGL